MNVKEKNKRNNIIKFSLVGMVTLIIFLIILKDEPIDHEVNSETTSNNVENVGDNNSDYKATGFGKEFEDEMILEEKYIKDIQEISPKMSKAFDDFAYLSGLASENVFIVGDEEWLTEMTNTLSTIQIQVARYRMMKPSPRYEDVHEEILKAMDHFDIFLSTYPVGVDTLDAEIIYEASMEMRKGNEYITKAAELINNKN